MCVYMCEREAEAEGTNKLQCWPIFSNPPFVCWHRCFPQSPCSWNPLQWNPATTPDCMEVTRSDWPHMSNKYRKAKLTIFPKCIRIQYLQSVTLSYCALRVVNKLLSSVSVCWRELKSLSRIDKLNCHPPFCHYLHGFKGASKDRAHWCQTQ